MQNRLKYVTLLLFFIAWMFSTGLLFRWLYDYVRETLDALATGMFGALVVFAFVLVLAVVTLIPLAALCNAAVRVADYLEMRLRRR